MPTGWPSRPTPTRTPSNKNPSLYVSQDGVSWSAPPGIVNPLIPKPALARRYNSDPHLALDPDGRLHLFYRAAATGTTPCSWCPPGTGATGARPR